jgi:hypothetical protein
MSPDDASFMLQGARRLHLLRRHVWSESVRKRRGTPAYLKRHRLLAPRKLEAGDFDIRLARVALTAARRR